MSFLQKIMGNHKSFLDSNPEQFLGDFKDFAKKAPKTNSIPVETYRQAFKTLWGTDMPKELSQLIVNLDELNFPYFRLWESAIPPIPTGNNIVEEAILTAQVEYPSNHIIDWFSGTFCLNKAGTNERYWSEGSYSFFYPVYEAPIREVASPHIYAYQHGSPDNSYMNDMHLFAKNTSAFLYFMMMLIL